MINYHTEDLYQQLNCACAWFNLTSIKPTIGAAHLKNRDTTPPEIRGGGVYVCRQNVYIVYWQEQRT
ncbi:MAG: hypothetical protein QOH70_2079 [Blastocatellia bacterium]|nr:hypothetical protein [Blastocatellia bacterium]